MITHSSITDRELFHLIRKGSILIAGNQKLRIYGHLNCKSGKRMLRKNRVFFFSEEEAIAMGFRPCGNCNNKKYLEYKSHK